ncbi:dihydroxy-acid dehydratase [Methylophilales bacterium HTCC2181]|uniref:Dihydroxy-acid dehydratase n=1 Tax=Methylophilales bacterium HTCC2181 TaxID=383631 RepID=A0P842_9PROT|nr:dihydroxy-acid dehydratase [Methylophilales bacterium HTCC2181]
MRRDVQLEGGCQFVGLGLDNTQQMALTVTMASQESYHGN